MSFLCEIQESSYSYMCMSFHVPPMKHRRLMTAACAFLLFFFSSHGYCCAWELEQRLVAVKGTSGALLIPLFFFLFNIPVAACFSAVLYSIISPFIHYRSAADQLCTWHTHTHTRARMDKREKTPFFPFLVVFVSRGQGILHLLFTLKEKKKKTEASFLMRVAKPLKRKPLHSYVLYYSHVRLSLMISLYCLLFICLFFFFFYGHHFLFSSDQLPGEKSKSATSFSTHKVKEHAQSQFVEHPNTVSVLWLLHWEYKLKRGKKNVCMHGSRNSGGYYCKIWLLVLTKWTLKPKRWV